MLLYRLLVNYFFIKMYIILKYDKNLWQGHGKSYKVDVRLYFILAARIAFWVFVHCILGPSVD
jgi:hypothetical protein